MVQIAPSNLRCCNCGKGFEAGSLFKNLETPDYNSASLTCDKCQEQQYPENALLEYLRSPTTDRDITTALSIGSWNANWIDSINIGETKIKKPTEVRNDAQIDYMSLLTAEHEKSDELLKIRRVDNSFTSFIVGDSIFLDVSTVRRNQVGLTASLLQDPKRSTIEGGDTVTVQYRCVMSPSTVSNPPWVNLLLQAGLAIRQNHPLPAAPLIVSAFHNQLFRQVYIARSEEGDTQEDIIEWMKDVSESHHISWKSIAKEGLKEITGSKLFEVAKDDYDSYCRFEDDVRNEIIHPNVDDKVVVEFNRDQAVKELNRVIRLSVEVYELCQSTRRI